MKVLSIDQPWASLLIAGVTSVVNMDVPTDYRGRILIHATDRRMTEDFFDEIPVEWAKAISNEQTYGNLPMDHELPIGSIIGAIELCGCDDTAKTSWDDAQKTYHWRFTEPLKSDSAVPHPEIQPGFGETDVVECMLPECYNQHRSLPRLEGDTLVIPVTSLIYEDLADCEDFSLYLDWDADYIKSIFTDKESVEKSPIQKLRFTNAYFSKERQVTAIAYCAEKGENGGDVYGPSRQGGEGLYDYVLFALKDPFME